MLKSPSLALQLGNRSRHLIRHHILRQASSSSGHSAQFIARLTSHMGHFHGLSHLCTAFALHLRLACLSLHDSPLLAVQRLVTEIIGQKRRRGMLRTELSKMLHMEATKFHYIANVSASLTRHGHSELRRLTAAGH